MEEHDSQITNALKVLCVRVRNRTLMEVRKLTFSLVNSDMKIVALFKAKHIKLLLERLKNLISEKVIC